MRHGKWKDLTSTFDEAMAKLPDALAAEGFGIITQIDVQQTFKAKLGIDYRRYRIFGACNPKFAHEALETDERVGVLLPCNVVLFERADGRAVLGAVDPIETMGAAAGPEFRELAGAVKVKLDRVLDAIA